MPAHLAARAAALATAALLMSAPAPLAAQAAAADVITEMSADDLLSLLREMGFSPQPLEDRENAWTIELKDRRVLVMLASTGQNVALWSYVTGDNVTLEKVNEWNRTKRFSRAYLDNDGDPNVEWDIDLEGGASRGAVREGIRTFGVVIDEFKAFFMR